MEDEAEMTVGSVNRIIIGRLNRGEDLYEGLMDVLKTNNVSSGALWVLGAIDRVKLGYYDIEERSYKEVAHEGMMELTSGIGNISLRDDGELVIHLHIVAQDEDGNTFSGHVLRGTRVGVTVEYIIMEIDGQLYRAYDEETGLYLLK
jgi:hypothetical protein